MAVRCLLAFLRTPRLPGHAAEHGARLHPGRRVALVHTARHARQPIACPLPRAGAPRDRPHHPGRDALLAPALPSDANISLMSEMSAFCFGLLAIALLALGRSMTRRRVGHVCAMMA